MGVCDAAIRAMAAPVPLMTNDMEFFWISEQALSRSAKRSRCHDELLELENCVCNEDENAKGGQQG